MSGARDTTTVLAKTLEANCAGCNIGGDPVGEEGYINPDCAANIAARREAGLNTEACGRILMQYAVDMDNKQVFTHNAVVDADNQEVATRGVITTKITRTLRKIFVQPVGGRWELFEHDYEFRGNSDLIIDLEDGSYSA